MAGRRLKILKSELQNVNFQYLGAFRLRIDVSDPSGSGADPNVFLYQRNLPNPYDGSVVDAFLTVASPVDMAEYPVGEPDSRTAYPFYRLPWLELDLRATSLAQEVYLLVIREINTLLLSLDRMEMLVPTEEVWVGAAPSHPDSISHPG